MYKQARHRSSSQWSYLAIDGMPSWIIGVYAFWCRDTGKCVYVGQALDEPIRERLLAHWRGSHNEILRLWIQVFGDHLIICYREVESVLIGGLEDRLIKRWKPEANIAGRPR